MNVLYKFFPVEIVDMIYLRTDFFTAINHIPKREFVLEQLFKKCSNKVIKCRNWGHFNKNYICITDILKKKCRRSLVYFKKAKPYVRITSKLFEYDVMGEIRRSEWNDLLISVYEIKDYEIKYFEKKHRFTRCITSTLSYP